MTLSLYEATIPSYRQIAASVTKLVAKAAAHCAERNEPDTVLIEARLTHKMLPFGYQVKAVSEHSRGAIEAVRAKVFSPGPAKWPDSFAGLTALLQETDDFLARLDRAEVNNFVGQDVRFEFKDRREDFTAEEFLLSYAQPSFYFHAATAYDILRVQGLLIGKRDFIGLPRVRG